MKALHPPLTLDERLQQQRIQERVLARAFTAARDAGNCSTTAYYSDALDACEDRIAALEAEIGRREERAHHEHMKAFLTPENQRTSEMFTAIFREQAAARGEVE